MKFVRLYSGDDGKSHFEDLNTSEASDLFQHTQSVSALVFKNDRPPHIFDWHTAPRRQWLITLSGSVEIRVGDGSVRTFGPGDVLLAEDLTGQGHTAVPNDNWTRAFIHLE